MTSLQREPCQRYHAGHPWYYRLDGRILYPSEIKAEINLSTYPDLMIEDILTASAMDEPRRSERLRHIRTKARADLHYNLNIYLERVRELKARRLDPDPPEQPISSCVYLAMSLKHSHLYNDYARLAICEHHLSRQGDLFG